MIELVGRSDSGWAEDTATRQSVAACQCNVQGVTMCNRSLKRTAISLSSCEAEFYAASACAGELLGLAELFQELHYKVSVRPEIDTKRTQAHRNSLFGWTAMDQRKSSIGWMRRYDRRYSGFLHEVFGWTKNAVALKEAWTTGHWEARATESLTTAPSSRAGA